MRPLTILTSLLLAASISVFSQQTVEAQTTYTFDQDRSSLHLYGTSNVRDWDAKVVIQNDEITVGEQNPGDNWIQSLTFEMPVSEVDSDSRRLNNNMHEYLGEDDHPTMRYELVQISDISENGNGYEIIANSDLTVNGVTRNIDLTAQVSVNDDGSITITGSYDTLMSNFDIDPPTAMLGSVRAEDDVTIEFDVTLVEAS